MNAREKAQRRWWRYPVDVPLNAPLGEDVARTPTTQMQVEYVAEFGALEPGETFPPDEQLEWLAAHGPLAPGEEIPEPQVLRGGTGRRSGLAGEMLRSCDDLDRLRTYSVPGVPQTEDRQGRPI